MRISVKTAVAGLAAVAMVGLAGTTATAAPHVRKDAAAVAPAASCYVHNVSGSVLNIRSGPGQTYSVLGTLAAGAKLSCGSKLDTQTKGQSYTSCGGGTYWSTIRINGRDGWVASECVAFGA
ncbi:MULTISPECIES: SH3 domain-containing protein [Streptomyces]|uniref:SH3 domain-containing protein n=2 Tax=Streptomyces TaxID=1883 RepID=A0ABU2RJ18_9ACTN|nr:MULTISPECIES: SH3 domain-containing protein [unclassified Streptomyces]MBK3595665.1 SH3 domain-containing protein [Streptomyces sp. MBT51]MDT0428845.1 SH3 domain-containing protein [Streptomyces sp. DSM 41770]HBF84899.1 SH3 domain-containing protein [Streptomyces sp.]